MQQTLIVRREKHIQRRPPRCSRAERSGEDLRWMGTEAQVEPQPGGIYLINVTEPRFARGSFREVVPGGRPRSRST
jgi:hypothetical protein